MSTILLTKYRPFLIVWLILTGICNNVAYSQNSTTNPVDSAHLQINSVYSDSTQIASDSIPEDSTTTFREMISPNAITSAIQYVATDSIQIGLKEQKVYLYNNVEIYYQDITLKAGYVEIDFKKNLLYATGIADSSGKTVQKPNFKQGEQNFTAANITYNFNTKKGLIKDIITQEGDSYLHGSVVKRFADNTTNVRDGKYTTCSEEHPHYEIKFFKAKVIPNDKIVTGPAYLVIEDVPTPLIVPFGFFPTKKGQVSGILMPTYGQSANRGFYFEDGGYYWGINDYVDLAVRGTIYTRGSWGAKVASSYSKRYRYQGNISISYAENIFGEKDLPDYRKDKSFFIRWQHKQDPKARPNSSFSANVNAGTNNYNKYNPTSAQDYLSNDFESTITYQTSFAQNRCNFAISAGYKQNTGTKEILLTAPELAFSVSRIYPFRKKNKTKLKFWDNISLGYTLNAANRINTPDSMLISNSIFRRMQNGISHNIPLNMSMKVFRVFTWNNSFNYNERWYFQSINKGFYNNGDTSYIYQDTIQGFQPARDFSVASSLTTKVYTMFQFKKGPVNAIRYVMTPNFSINYHPDFGNPWWGYYRYTVSDTLGHYQRYSRFQNGIYGTPPDGRSGKIGLGLSNNLEMKVRSRKDTITGTKKIMLIEDLTIRTAYDLARDSLNWDNLTVSGRTRLFKRIDINYSGNWDFYAIDTNGNRINQFEWDVNHKLLRKTSYQWSVSVGFTLSSKDFKKKTDTDNSGTNAPPSTQYHPVPDVDYNNPWSLTFNYNLTYGKRYSSIYDRMVPDTSHTLNVSGDIAITKKWKFGFTTGYDFVHNNFSYTSINVYRDLHCWEMILNWIPMGYRQSYNFTIRVKASILQDLKLEKKTDWRDYY